MSGCIDGVMCIGCDICDALPEPVAIGQRYKGAFGNEWKVIGFDASGQGAILRGSIGQIQCEPVNPDGGFMFPGLTLI